MHLIALPRDFFPLGQIWYKICDWRGDENRRIEACLEGQAAENTVCFAPDF